MGRDQSAASLPLVSLERERTLEERAISAAMRAYIGEVTLMAAIVTSLLCVPVGALLAGLLYVAGISLHAFATFGGALDGFLALLAWWVLGFLPALGYSAYLVPWSRRES